MKQRGVVAGAAALLAVMAATAIVSSAQPFSSQDEEALPSEGERATEYIVWALTLEKSPAVRKGRERCGKHCGDYGSGIEVATDLLGVGGQATSDSLLNLLAVQLDAGAAESRSCQIAKRGKALVPTLATLDASTALQWCGTTFERLRKRELAGINDVSVEEVCRPMMEIEQDRRDWIAALQSEDLFAEMGAC